MVEYEEVMSGGGPSPADELAGGVSLDALFRANAAGRAAPIALADPANRADITDGAPRRLTYAEADAAVERLARQLRSFGLPAGSVVVVQLPNIVESVLSLLAILRAGMVAAPVPMLWRRSDLVSALAPIEPKALITLARLGDERPAEIACEAAAELFSLSFPCCFGENVPDGVIALDQEDGAAEALGAAFAPAPASAVTIVTFDAAPKGFFAAARNDAQWLAAGLAVLLEAKIGSGDTIVTTLPANSLAGIGGAIVPWLLSGGTLELVQGASPALIAAAGKTARSHLLAPAAILPDLTQDRSARLASCIAVHRGRASMRDFASVPCDRIVDLFAFGEIGAVALQREERREPSPIPLGPISTPAGAVGAPVVIETQLDGGEVLLRGPMVPRLAVDTDGFVASGYRCKSNGNGAFIVVAGPERVVSVGGLRFGLDDLRARFSKCNGGISVAAVEDALLGQRLRIEADDPPAAAAAMEAAGHSRLVIDALAQHTDKRRAAG